MRFCAYGYSYEQGNYSTAHSHTGKMKSSKLGNANGQPFYFTLLLSTRRQCKKQIFCTANILWVKQKRKRPWCEAIWAEQTPCSVHVLFVFCRVSNTAVTHVGVAVLLQNFDGFRKGQPQALEHRLVIRELLRHDRHLTCCVWMEKRDGRALQPQCVLSKHKLV